MSDIGEKSGFRFQFNGWVVAALLILVSVGFAVFGTPEQHDMFLSGLERIFAATENLLN